MDGNDVVIPFSVLNWHFNMNPLLVKQFFVCVVSVCVCVCVCY